MLIWKLVILFVFTYLNVDKFRFQGINFRLDKFDEDKKSKLSILYDVVIIVWRIWPYSKIVITCPITIK